MERISEVNINTPYFWRSYWSDANRRLDNFINTSEELDNLGELATGRILDVGCGSGHHTKYLKGDVTVCDISQEAVDYVKEKLGFDGFVCDVREGLPVKDKSFDTAICTEVLEHLDEPLELLKELKRVADKVIISLPNGDEAKRFEDHVWSFEIEDLKKDFQTVYSPNGKHIIAIYEAQ